MAGYLDSRNRNTTMRLYPVPFSDIREFSKIDKAYVAEDSALRPFYAYETELTEFPKIIENRKGFDLDRQALVQGLLSQYEIIPHQESTRKQIRSLGLENTFTVTTAHQPSLFTGPLYFIYKIISTINLADKLNTTYPEYHFVPMYWSGAEDHDFEEINHLRVFGKKIVWETNSGGSVGQLDTSTLLPVIKELSGILGESAQDITRILSDIFTRHKKYGNAVLEFVHRLFGEKGLIAIDPSRQDFKRLFVPHMEKELLEQPSEALVAKAHQQLENAGFAGQAFPRAVNLFYVGEGYRERIEPHTNGYEILNLSQFLSREKILDELNKSPERFSPNVIMRPLYQEAILPNLAYIGGGGEIAYWLERKEQFKTFGASFPMLLRRDSVLWIDNGTWKKMEKSGLGIKDILGETEVLIKRKVKEISDAELQLQDEKKDLEKVFATIRRKAELIDPTLSKSVDGELAKALKGFTNLEGKMIRAEKKKHETTTQRIRTIKEKLFPEGNLQERKDNFLPLYTKHGKSFFDTLYQFLNPLDKRFKIIIEE